MDRPDRPETFKAVPGFSYYEWGDLGTVRSLDRRTADGRTVRGRVMSQRDNSSGYPQVNLVDDNGATYTRTVHTMVLLAHDGPCPDGYQACHKDDDPHHCWFPENLRWGTRPDNLADRRRNRPPAPKVPPPLKPPKVCPRCSAEHRDPGRRCHACVVELGEQAAALLQDGVPLDRAAERLDYPSHSGLLLLAQRYGALHLSRAVPSQDVTECPATLRHAFKVILAVFTQRDGSPRPSGDHEPR